MSDWTREQRLRVLEVLGPERSVEEWATLMEASVGEIREDLERVQQVASDLHEARKRAERAEAEQDRLAHVLTKIAALVETVHEREDLT